MVASGMKKVSSLLSAGFLLLVTALQANADYSWNFPEPVTPMALDTLHVHNKFMVVTMIIFVVVLGIMIYSIFAHRKSKGYKAVADKPITKKAKYFGRLYRLPSCYGLTLF